MSQRVLWLVFGLIFMAFGGIERQSRSMIINASYALGDDFFEERFFGVGLEFFSQLPAPAGDFFDCVKGQFEPVVDFDGHLLAGNGGDCFLVWFGH